jgi:hypothetical protein
MKNETHIQINNKIYHMVMNLKSNVEANDH